MKPLLVAPGRAACLVVLLIFAGVSVLSQTPVQDPQPQTAKPEITLALGERTVWGSGPDGFFTETSLTARDGSSMIMWDYVYRTKSRLKELLNNCTKDAVRLVDNQPGPTVRKVRRRTLAIFRDNTGRESAILCRSDGKHMLTKIYGSTVENVLGLERTEFPKKN